MTNATDELRALLDERGVAWRAAGPDRLATRYSQNGVHYIARPADDEVLGDHFLRVSMIVYPEQAVEATLGRGECHAVPTGMGTAFCSECGAEYMGSIMTNEPPDYVTSLRFCPNCGRRVVS